MSTLSAKISDLLLQQVKELAAKEHVAADQIVSAALSAQVSASNARESILARCVDWKKVEGILDHMPDAPPLFRARIPPRST